MEDEEEIQSQSHASPGSESHSPLSSGRVTVTVAAASPLTTTKPTPPPISTTPGPLPQSSLTLALPIQQAAVRPVGAIGSGGGREDCWSEGATSVLIDAWGERYMELSRGNLKQKHWKEVADIVSSRDDYTKNPKTDIQCKNRIDTVKKKYKIEKAKVTSGAGPSRWPFFDRLDRLIGSSAACAATAVAISGGSNSHKAVPVGIPVGVRPLPLPLPLPHFNPQLQTPPHIHHHHQQQHNNNYNIRQSFLSPISAQNLAQNQRFSANVRSNFSNNSKQHQQQQQQQEQQLFRRGPALRPPESDSEPDDWSPDSTDSFPPGLSFEGRKRPRIEMRRSGVNNRETKGEKGKEKRMGRRKRVCWGNSVRELTRAILKFGEAYEAAESAKLQQIVEMEKQRMKFAKELELQRMKFLMKTQLELSQLNNHGSNDNNNNNNNNDDRSCSGGSSGRKGGGGGGGGCSAGVVSGGGDSNHRHHHENHVNHANSDSSHQQC